MSIRRTKQQKATAQQHRVAELNYSYSHQGESSNKTLSFKGSSRPEEETSPSASQWASLFGYDPALIYRDLQKTLLVVAVMITVLVGIYFFLRK
jgi:hypothetical protein